MSPTRLLVGQIVVIFAIVLVGIWFATQWTAVRLAYQPELGRPWFTLFHIAVYRPWKVFPWWYHFDAYAPRIFSEAGAIAGASGFAGCGAAIAGSLWRARQGSLLTTYGSARWAQEGEVRRAGLLNDAGVFLGRFEGHYLRHDGPEHVMAFAPTRSGKGVGLVVPTLLGWTGSAVIHDIKGENWQLTAGFRSRFSHCLGPKGEAQLINFRVRGHFYVVDRLFDAAELRLGLKHQDIVRITRGGTPKLGRG